jgi:cellulose synthase/poly-beta-1,6-N-acetylglucosamine synthase-like glycosyltransferase
MSANDPMPMVSVIMPIRNERNYLRRCLDTLFAGDYPQDRLEFVLVDGESDDGTQEFLAEIARERSNVVVLHNPKRIVPPALNLALGVAKGEFIVRVDAHTLYDPDYVRRCVELLTSTGASNVGGAQRAVGTDYLSWAIAIATTSRFGAGDAKFRFSEEEAWVETVYLGAWRKKTLDDIGGFDERFVVNQDYELNHRIIRTGGRILLSPKIKCQYFVRPSLRKLAKQYFRYGMWRVHTMAEHPSSVRWRQLVPPAFVAALILSALLAMAGVAWPFVTLLVAYLASALLASAAQCAQRGWQYLPILPLIFLTLHLTWGSGFLVGIFRFWLPRRLSA